MNYHSCSDQELINICTIEDIDSLLYVIAERLADALSDLEESDQLIIENEENESVISDLLDDISDLEDEITKYEKEIRALERQVLGLQEEVSAMKL